jgi:hypothetical protein
VPPSPRLQVIATTAEGTRAALVEARRLASRTEPIVLLVPHVTTLATLRQGPDHNARLVEGYRALASATGVEAIVRLCHCVSYRDVVRWMLDRPSLIVIGGRRRWLWPTTAQRMVRAVQRAGHRVVFADVG